MEFRYKNLATSLALLSLLASPSLSFFSPADNHLVNCGSAADAAVYDRRFVSDHAKSPFCHSDSSRALANDGVSLDSSHLYDTARVFDRPSKYEFEITEKGHHMVRLHFKTLNSPKFDPQSAQFHVLIDEFVALTNFTLANSQTPLIKEYLIPIDSDKLAIRFLPSDPSKFAFVNAIEVISAPKDLVPDSAQLVNSEKVEIFDVSPNQALEIVHRVTVGGPKVTPFNDTLWRTWLPDEDYLRSSSGSERLYFGGRIKYQVGGSSREIGPDNVYKSARLIRSHSNSIPDAKLAWEFPVSKGFDHLVRLHFCDIASISLELLFFNVYINGNLAYKDLDLSNLTNWMLASPVYLDFVADSGDKGVVSVAVGPSKSSIPYAVDAILNGVEIAKLNNSMGSLDGAHCARFVLKQWRASGAHRGGLVVPLIAFACVALSLSIVLRRRMAGGGDAWSRLPVDVSEVDVKGGVRI